MHLVGRKADEVKTAGPSPELGNGQLEVLVSDAVRAVGHVAGEVAMDPPQDLNVLATDRLIPETPGVSVQRLFGIRGLEIDEFGQRSPDVHSKPWHR